MRYYVRTEIERFLRAVDLALKRPATAVVIGGGAALCVWALVAEEDDSVAEGAGLGEPETELGV